MQIRVDIDAPTYFRRLVAERKFNASSSVLVELGTSRRGYARVVETNMPPLSASRMLASPMPARMLTRAAAFTLPLRCISMNQTIEELRLSVCSATQIHASNSHDTKTECYCYLGQYLVDKRGDWMYVLQAVMQGREAGLCPLGCKFGVLPSPSRRHSRSALAHVHAEPADNAGRLQGRV